MERYLSYCQFNKLRGVKVRLTERLGERGGARVDGIEGLEFCEG